MEYAIDYSQALVAEVRQILEAARAAGDESVVRALREMWRRLRTDPLDFGEPLYHLHHPEAAVRQAMVRPLAVVFAVYEEIHRVWLVSVEVLEGPGL